MVDPGACTHTYDISTEVISTISRVVVGEHLGQKWRLAECAVVYNDQKIRNSLT